MPVWTSDLYPLYRRDRVNILVSATGEVHDNGLICRHARCDPHGVGYGVTGFKRWYDSFHAGQYMECVQRLGIRLSP